MSDNVGQPQPPQWPAFPGYQPPAYEPPKRKHHRVRNFLVRPIVLIVGVGVVAAIAGNSPSPSPTPTTHHAGGSAAPAATTSPATTSPATTVAATTTEPHSVVPGETLTGFEIYVASKLRAAPFKVTGITTVDCALPKTWTAGLVFPCLRPQERRWPKARSL